MWEYRYFKSWSLNIVVFICCSEGNEGISGSRVVFTDSENPWLSCLTSK